MIIEDITNKISQITGLEVGKDIFISELPENNSGNALVVSYAQSPEPNKSLEYYKQTINIWSYNKSSSASFELMKTLFNYFHRNHHYLIGANMVYLSYSTGLIDDYDRDSIRRKIHRLNLVFVYRNEIS